MRALQAAKSLDPVFHAPSRLFFVCFLFMNIYEWSRVREMRVCDFTVYIEANPSTSNSVFNITEQQQQASF